MRNRTTAAVLAALVGSVVAAGTADARGGRFFKRNRGQAAPAYYPTDCYNPYWQADPAWYPPSASWPHGTPGVAAQPSRPVTETADVKPIPLGEKSHDGTVVKVGVNTLTMTGGADGKEHSHAVPADAKVTRDGATAKLEDLRKGDIVVVTTKTNPEMTVVKVDARQKR